MATTTTTETISSEPHKNSMKSTWRNKPETWNASHHALNFFNAFSSCDDRPVPVHSKQDKVPFMSEIESNRWILFYAAIPMVIHQVYVWTTGNNLSWYNAALLYGFFYQFNALITARFLKRLGHQIGFFDGEAHARDGVPDNSVTKVLMSLVATTVSRPLLMVALSYKADEAPLSISLPWLFVEIGVYSITLDFYFYWYHRSMHELDSLWVHHRTHHLTKHPISLLSAFADEEQEFFDIIVCPLATFLTMKLFGFPMSFYDWWVCYEYVIFAENLGHSGLRMCSTPPSSLTPLLWATGCELIGEDHDLHHRFGYKTSGNYGKQTRLWDRIFGTCKERDESVLSNVDFNDRVKMPLFRWPALPPKFQEQQARSAKA